MTRRRPSHRDPLDSVIESALQPGCYIDWDEGASFVSDLRDAEREIAKLVNRDPARAVALYEAFIAACNLKAEEVDDADGEFGEFAGSLFCGWIQARQASRADRRETAEILLSWMDNDDYGFCNDLPTGAVKVLDRTGLAAFEEAVQARFEAACAKREQPGNYMRNRWGRILKSVYARQRSVEKYLGVTARTGLTQADCEAIASVFQAKRKPNDALAWLDRGIEMERAEDACQRGAGYRLAGMRRALLAKLGREAEALDSAWTEFQRAPNTYTYEELLRYVPKAGRDLWHDKAMAAAERGDLASLIELWLSAKEIERLAERLDRASNSELEGLSHYVTEPAAKRLARTHPAVAAKVYRALCVRVLDAAKSKYYCAALANLEEARRCYQAAGLETQWKALVAQIRRDHRRKSGFMPGFEAIVAGKRARVDPSFLDQARGQWAQKTKA